MASPVLHALSLPAVSSFGLHEQTSASGLRVQVLPSGALFALRHRETLLNQFLPGPAEDGLFRLVLRTKDAAGAVVSATALVGPTVAHRPQPLPAWRVELPGGVHAVTTLHLHPQLAAWAWRVTIENRGGTPWRGDVLHAQDLGLADEGAVRNNEAYVSQYLDLLPLHDAQWGHVVLARQNQAMAGGRRPWAAFGCAEGAVAFCTDGVQFFGADHRLTQTPAACARATLPSLRSQQEFAVAGLQSRDWHLAPGASATLHFVAAYREDHPAASSAPDIAALRALLPLDWVGAAPADGFASPEMARSPFLSAPMVAGDDLGDDGAARHFPAPWRHVERDATGRLQSFFAGAETHVVTRAKEAAVARPHGHILRSGSFEWIDDAQFGVTCYAAGIFGAQAYLGNPSLARLCSVVRNHLGVPRASGQRIFVRRAGAWRQLGLPSLFSMVGGEARWIYEWPDLCLEARVSCLAEQPASVLELRVLRGAAQELLVTHQLALGANEFDAPGSAQVQAAEGWMALEMDPRSFAGERLPGTCFGLALDAPAHLAALGGLDVVSPELSGPYACLVTKPVTHCAVLMFGSTTGAEALPRVLADSRAALRTGAAARARPPAAPVSLVRDGEPGVSRVNDILPWFTHNAAIHFSAPHGLEQYGGAAWGVRDVCQGSVEWLLAAGRADLVRGILRTVFAQQYAAGEQGSSAGGWPQWFMFRPFHAIQQAHSHGDVCFWPVKALCDYVEASNDFSLLGEAVGYTDPKTFEPVGPAETLWAHCDRVVALAEARFVPGTALVNYGDGDWDDTLQPADPTLRTRMVSAWTVALAYQTFRQLAEVSRRAGEPARAARLDEMLARMRTDFSRHLVPDGTVAGFLVREADGSARPLLHPSDKVTGIRYRLLPMTRSVIAELFSPDQAARHLEIVERELRYTDGVRLMSEPAVYCGGLERLFKRAETAANVGREVGLQYVHAHLRYAEAMAKIGDADRLWQALQVVNPVALGEILPNAAPRQSNVYFSSSDADFEDRVVAAERWNELRAGRVTVRAGWRLYSSGPGLYLHKVRACLLGVRESFDAVVFDPVLPRGLDGLVARTSLLGRPVSIRYSVQERGHTPRAIRLNGQAVSFGDEPNPYRTGGARIARADLAARLQSAGNEIEIDL